MHRYSMKKDNEKKAIVRLRVIFGVGFPVDLELSLPRLILASAKIEAESG